MLGNYTALPLRDPLAEVMSIAALLPPDVAEIVRREVGNENHRQSPLMELFVDKGCVPALVYRDRNRVDLNALGRTKTLEPYLKSLLLRKRADVGSESTTHAEDWLSELNSYFTKDNRMGIEGTLHRISCKRDRRGTIDGLTYRVGRHMPGCCEIVQDVIANLAPNDANAGERQSLLLMGKPGTGTNYVGRGANGLKRPAHPA